MIDVYILLSNEFRFLEIQVELIKKYVKNVGNIYGVMGPIGGVKMFSQNHVKDIPITPIIIPPNKSFFAIKQRRLAKIVNFLIENYINKSEHTGLIIHADVFPISEFDMPKDLNIVGRGSNDKSNFSITWLAANPGAKFVNYVLDKSYSTYFPQDDKFKKVFGLDKDPEINIEWCNPCFIHTDDSSRDDGKFDKKFEFLKQYLKLKEDITFSEEALLPQDIISLAKRYAKEREMWVRAGKPLRSPEEIERIFRICSGCPFFFADSSVSGSCSICGCHIKKRGKLMNKAAWATTECPKTPSEWLPEKNPEIFAKTDLPVKKCCGK